MLPERLTGLMPTPTITSSFSGAPTAFQKSAAFCFVPNRIFSKCLGNSLSRKARTFAASGVPALQLDDHLKNLLRELGHAINDTVSESDRITGAIAGVRAHGYDIVLKLDATIGLAKRDAAGNHDSKLTTLDRRFLESLRIQVDQDSFSEPELARRSTGKLT